MSEGLRSTPPGSLCAAREDGPDPQGFCTLCGAPQTTEEAIQGDYCASCDAKLDAVDPSPVSSNERDYWRVYQQRLREKLEASND